MIQKVLLIGVGGSGGKLLRYVGRELERRESATRTGTLGSAPSGPLLPPEVQFLQIDVREHSDAVADDVPLNISGSYVELGLAESTHNYQHYDRLMVSRPGSIESVAGWRPDPRGDFPPPYLGAGQYRAVGRTVGLATIDKISQRLDEAIAAISDTGQDAGQENEPLVILASSLAGGSGSGLFLDVAELVMGKATAGRGWLRENLISVLFSADMFEGLDKNAIDGVYANSLAALSELLNGFDHSGPVAESESALLEPAGISPTNGARTGPYNFFIGRSVGKTIYGSPNDVYRSTAKAIAAFLHNADINAEFTSYLGVNGLARPVSMNPEFNLVEEAHTRRPAASLGYANVTLGNELFRSYVAQALTKRAIRTLLEGHRLGFEDEKQMTDDDKVEERATGESHSFFDDCGLHELGTENNDVLDFLRRGKPTDRKSRLESLRQKLEAAVKGGNRPQAEKLKWWNFFKDEYDAVTKQFLTDEQEQLSARGPEWVEEVQRRLVATTVDECASQGFRVAIKLLDLLSEQLAKAADELEVEADQERDAQTSKWTESMNLFRQITDAVVGPNHAAITQATHPAIQSLDRRLEVEVREVAVILIRELVADYIPELRKAVNSAFEDLQHEVTRLKDNFNQLPDKEVPPHLRATQNEVLLVPQDDSGDRMERLLVETYTGPEGKDAGRSPATLAIMEIVSGSWADASQVAKGEKIEQSFIQVASGEYWRPKSKVGLRDDARPGKPGFRVNFGRRNGQLGRTLADLINRSSEWVAQRAGALSSETSQSLREWITEGTTGTSTAESPARVDEFVNALTNAINRAKPMISIDETIFAQVHADNRPEVAFTIGSIPLDKTGDGAKQVVSLLTKNGIQASKAEELIDSMATGDEVEIASFLGKSIHPIAIDSLARPIDSDWTRRVTDGARRDYWTRRRARRLESFVPLAPSRLEAFVRGWFTGVLLGEIGQFDVWTGDVDIWTPKGPKKFPEHTLGGNPRNRTEAIGALLETLPLAMIEYTSGKPESLEACLRVITLGLSPQNHGRHVEPSVELSRWLVSGVLPEAEVGCPEHPIPNLATAGPQDGAEDERRTAVLATLEAARTGFMTRASEYKLTENPDYVVPRTYEIANLVDRELGNLHEAVRGIADVEPGDDTIL